MDRNVGWAIILVLVAGLLGCGGAGSSGAGNSLSVEEIKLTSGNTWSTGSVRDDGLVFGVEGSSGLNQTDAIWPAPGQIVTIPKLDSVAYFQNIDAVTADQQTILGNTIDVYNSLGPGRGFVYYRSTQKFHVLIIPDASQYAPVPEAIQADGTVLGTFLTTSNTGEVLHQFVYNLATDTYTETTLPRAPKKLTALAFTSCCQSPNHLFYGGDAQVNGHDQAAVVNYQTGDYRLIGPADEHYQASAVSNDGTVAVISTNPIEAGSPTFVWSGNKLTNLFSLCKARGIGADWQWLNFVSLSPGGKYLTFTGENSGVFGVAARIRIP